MEYFIDGLRISDKRIHQLAIDSKGLQGDIDHDPILAFYEIGQRVKIKWTSGGRCDQSRVHIGTKLLV